jgi:hypothetical protein
MGALEVMIKLIFSVLLLAALIGCKGEEPISLVPADVSSAVIKQLAEAGIEAKEVDQAKGLFKPVDLTAQAAPDWLVDFSALPSAPLCGTGGCPLQVWVKIGASPYTLAFDRQVLGHAVDRHDNGRRLLAVELHGVLCGGTGSDACRYHFEWRGNADAPNGYFAAASIWGKPLRYEGPLVQALPVQAPPGSAVAKALEAYRTACAAAGGTAELEDALVFLPDLNRDMQRELLFDAGWAYCQRDDAPVAMKCAGETCKSRLFSEHGGQAWRAAWSGEPFAYSVDFSQPEPRLLTHPADCDLRSPEQCTELALVWQDTNLTFVLIPVSPLDSVSPSVSR